MAAVIENFTTVRKTRGDILKPNEYTTIVNSLITIMRENHYTSITQAYNHLLCHIAQVNNTDVELVISANPAVSETVNRDKTFGAAGNPIATQDPHKTPDALLPTIMDQIYAYYTTTSSLPMSQNDFNNKIVGTPLFLEVIRRCILDNYLYEQVADSQGFVPINATVSLTLDYGNRVYIQAPVTLTIPSGASVQVTTLTTELLSTLTTETGSSLITEGSSTPAISFNQLGFGDNTSFYATILNNNDFDISDQDLPVVFSVSQSSIFLIDGDVGNGYTVPVQGCSSSFSAAVAIAGIPTGETTIFGMGNTTNLITVTLDSSLNLRIYRNSVLVSQVTPCIDGYFRITYTKNGKITFDVKNNNLTTSTTITNVGFMGSALTQVILGTGISDPVSGDNYALVYTEAEDGETQLSESGQYIAADVGDTTIPIFGIISADVYQGSFVYVR